MLRGTTVARPCTNGGCDMAVKVAVFGTPRSGKGHAIDVAISQLSSRGIPSAHVSSARMLSQQLDEDRLSSMDAWS